MEKSEKTALACVVSLSPSLSVSTSVLFSTSVCSNCLPPIIRKSYHELSWWETFSVQVWEEYQTWCKRRCHWLVVFWALVSRGIRILVLPICKPSTWAHVSELSSFLCPNIGMAQTCLVLAGLHIGGVCGRVSQWGNQGVHGSYHCSWWLWFRSAGSRSKNPISHPLKISSCLCPISIIPEMVWGSQGYWVPPGLPSLLMPSFISCAWC